MRGDRFAASASEWRYRLYSKREIGRVITQAAMSLPLIPPTPALFEHPRLGVMA
jgi:hypothetical protein